MESLDVKLLFKEPTILSKEHRLKKPVKYDSTYKALGITHMKNQRAEVYVDSIMKKLAENYGSDKKYISDTIRQINLTSVHELSHAQSGYLHPKTSSLQDISAMYSLMDKKPDMNPDYALKRVLMKRGKLTYTADEFNAAAQKVVDWPTYR